MLESVDEDLSAEEGWCHSPSAGTRLQCVAQQLGLLLIVLRRYCGRDWKSSPSWSGSLDSHHRHLRKVSKFGTNLKDVTHGSMLDRSCGWGGKFRMEIDHTFQRKVAGKDVKEFFSPAPQTATSQSLKRKR